MVESPSQPEFSTNDQHSSEALCERLRTHYPSALVCFKPQSGRSSPERAQCGCLYYTMDLLLQHWAPSTKCSPSTKFMITLVEPHVRK